MSITRRIQQVDELRGGVSITRRIQQVDELRGGGSVHHTEDTAGG